MLNWNETAWFSVLAGAALKSAALLAAAWLITAILRRRSAAARHLVWTAAAMAVLLLPMLSAVVPAIHIRGVGALLSSAPTFVTQATASFPSAPPPETPAHTSSTLPMPFAARHDWKLWLMLVWAVGVAAALAELAAAWAVIARVRRAARPASGRVLCAELSRDFGIRRRVDLRESAAGSMPMTFGLLRSTIFLPEDAVEWTDERRRIVLLHELAHVRRGDAAAHLLARAAVCLHWWNPLAWIAWRELLKESERAADDLVLSLGARASDYAGHLLDVARSMQSAGWAAVAMARRSHLEDRLSAILASNIDRRPPARAWSVTAAVAAAALVIPLAALHAQDDSSKPAVPSDVEAAVRAATAQKNYRILEDAAKAAEQSRKYDVAKELLEPAAAIRAEVAGQGSIDYAMGLLKLGELENKRNLAESAKDFYTRASQILGDNPAAAPALIYLGRNALTNKDFSQAADYFQRAQTVDPTHAGTATLWMAITYKREGNADKAAEMYRQALGQLGVSSGEAVAARLTYAQFLRSQNRDSEAKEMETQAATLQKDVAAQARSRITVSPDAFKISDSGVTAPKLLQKQEPQYSEEARLAGIAGTETLYIEVGLDGMAHNIQVLSSPGFGLTDKGVDTVSHWQFQPGAKDGQPVSVGAIVEINWRLL